MILKCDTKEDKKKLFFMLVSLAIVPFVLYYPSLKYEFLYELDDDWLVISNDSIKAISRYGLLNGLKFLFFYDTTDLHYMPVTYLSYSIDYILFDINPVMIKLHNLFLHILSGILLFIFTDLLLKRRHISFIIAFIFLIHPMNIESIAWASCRKQGLFYTYFLASMICYKLFLNSTTKKLSVIFYTSTIVSWIIATLAKTTAITLPGVFLLIYLHQNKHTFKIQTIAKHLAPMLPFVIVFWYLNTLANDRSYLIRDFEYTNLEHLTLAGFSYSFYWLKSFFPFPLVVFYPAPAEHLVLPLKYFILSFTSCILICLMIFHFIKGHYNRFFALGFYTITILPMLNLMFYPFGDLPMLVSNRYFYHTPLGIILYTILTADKYISNLNLKRGLLAAYICIIVFLFRIHLPVFRNQITMFENNAKYYPSEEFLYKLALQYESIGQTEKAIICLDKADNLGTNIWFNNPWSYYLCRSRLYIKAGKYDQALKDINTAIKKTEAKTEYQDSLLLIDKGSILQLIDDRKTGRDSSNIQFNKLEIYAGPTQ